MPNEGGQPFIDSADPSWYPMVLRTLARDYPEISKKVWETTITENAIERTEKKSDNKD